ncbi:MAG: tRNA (N6-threonylcarbamoyladenosine(37)-N6)-methyltransferase TrmO [Candidatus Thermoplasmatota archaeon]|nr:tRNA (N6-threonylcarbamoyladenosine(37)-N6)-methyltransferase TrmO [Candidatus Thermoplasmatota archaeon]
MDNIVFKPIGVIRTPFKEPKGVPIQPSAGKGIKGSIEIFDEYKAGLKGLDGFSHIVLLFHLHLHDDFSLEVVPFLDNRKTGVFSTRAPRRPNAIGLSVTRLIDIRENILTIEDIDIVDGTPLLDIKPYIPSDRDEEMKLGWVKGKIQGFDTMKADGRFLNEKSDRSTEEKT